MSNIQVHGGIPLPTSAHTATNQKYAFDKLAVGQCFFVSFTERLDGEEDSSKLRDRIAKAARAYVRKVGTTELEPKFVAVVMKEEDPEFKKSADSNADPSNWITARWQIGDVGVWRLDDVVPA